MKEAQLMANIRSGNGSKGLQRLYRYYPVVEKMILSHGGRKADAQDIYQEALIIFYRKVRSIDFELTSSIDTYLFGICKYLWRDHLRKKQSEKAGTIEVSWPNESEDWDNLMEEERQFGLAESALQQLGQRCRELLERFYLRKERMKAIAREMGFSSENSVKNQKYKCLENARKRLQKMRQSSSLNPERS